MFPSLSKFKFKYKYLYIIKRYTILKAISDVIISERNFIILPFKMIDTPELVAKGLINRYLKILVKV